MNGLLKGALVTTVAVAAVWLASANTAEAWGWRTWAPGYTTYYAPAPYYSYSPGYYYPGYYSYSWPGFSYYRGPAVVLPRTYYYGGYYRYPYMARRPWGYYR